MNAFNNDQNLKNEILSKLKHHEELDAFIQGQWLTDEKIEGNGFKGCFYGCTMQTNENAIEKFSEKYSIDLWYCYLTEKIFEGLPEHEAKTFPYKSIEIIPVGFDFNKIKSDFFKANLLKQKEWIKEDSVLKVLDECASLFDIPFNEIQESAAWSAWSAARSAAESAAWSAAWSAAESAESAAWSAAWSAWSAARSAAWSAKQSHYVWMRDLLFSLFK